MNIFYRDQTHSISWQKLIEDVKQNSFYHPFCYETNYYEIFKRIIISILIDREIVLLDGDFTSAEIERIIGSKVISAASIPLESSMFENVYSKEDLIHSIIKSAHQWRLVTF